MKVVSWGYTSKDGDNHVNWKSLISEAHRDPCAILFKTSLQKKEGAGEALPSEECKKNIKEGQRALKKKQSYKHSITGCWLGQNTEYQNFK